MLLNCSSLVSNSVATLQLSTKTGPYDGWPRNYADFEHNISLYYKLASDKVVCGNFSVNGASEWEWLPRNGIGPLHHALTALLSTAVNLLVITLSLFSGHLTKDFRFFFANLSLADLLYSLARWRDYISGEYQIHVKREPYHMDQCTIAVTNQIAFGASTIFATFGTSFHRYNVIVKKNFRYFTKPKITMICLLCYTPIFWPILLIVIGKQFIYTGRFYCPFIVHSDFVSMKLLVVPVASAGLLHAYYLARLKYLLSKNLNEIAVQLNKPVSEVKGKDNYGILPLIELWEGSIFFD